MSARPTPLFLASAAAALAQACVSIPAPAHDDADVDGCEDVDGDGYRVAGCSPTLPADCAEGEAGVHPGAWDDCQTPADEDCAFGPNDCASSIQGVSESVSGNVTSLETSSVIVSFDSAQNFSITELVSTALGGENLVHTGGNNERYIGSHMWPIVFSYQAEPTVTRLAAGPAAYRYQVDWSVTNQIESATLSGSTTYSIYPDGRIHRSERLVPDGAAAPFSTYLTLDPAQFSHRLNPADLSIAMPLLESAPESTLDEPFTDAQPSQALQARSCAFDDTSGLALSYAWNAYDIPAATTSRVRLPESNFSGHQFAMIVDWDSSDPPMDTYRGAFQIMIGTSLATEQAPYCTEFARDADAFLHPPSVAPGIAVTDLEADFDSDGYVDDGGYYALDAAGQETIEVAFEALVGAVLPESYSLHLINPPNALDPVIYLESDEAYLSHGRDYLLHREADNSLWLLVNRAMDPSDPLRIVFP